MIFISLLLAFYFAPFAGAAYSASPPNQVTIESEIVTTESGNHKISDLFPAETPILLVPAYYNCNSTCPLLAENLKQAIMSANASSLIGILFVSFNSEDDSTAMVNFRKHHGLPKEWVLSVIKNPNRAKDFLAPFQYTYQKTNNGFDHPNAAFVFSARPRVWTGSLYGVDITQGEMKTALDAATLTHQAGLQASVKRAFGKKEYLILLGIIGTILPLFLIAWIFFRKSATVV